MKAWARIAALFLGLGLFGIYLSRVDWRAVGELGSRLGWLAPLILVPYLGVYVVDCLGWRLAFPPGLGVRFRTLFVIRWCGEAVNNVLPSAYVGGEAVKVYLLREQGVPARAGTSAAIVSKTSQSVAQLVFILLGSLAFLGLAGDHPGLRTGMVVVLTGGTVVLTVLFWVQRRGVFASILAAAGVLGLKSRIMERHRPTLLKVDEAVTGFYGRHRPRFQASVGVFFGGWLLDSSELFLFAWLLDLPITGAQALAVEAFTGVAKVLGMWIPGSLGVQESGIVLLSRLAGLPDHLGAAYALLRRARELLFALVGWLLLSGQHTNLRRIRTETNPSAATQGEFPSTNLNP